VDAERLCAYLAALVLVGGSLSDIYGRRRIFILGVVVFVAASGLCAAARMRSFVGPRTEEIIGALSTLPVLSWEALVFGIPRERWEGILLTCPP
jgi:MFS family permease